MSSVLSVSQLTASVKGRLEENFPFVWVRGQVINLSRPASGHVYFTLRDEEAGLAAVWFKQRQKSQDRFDPLTGEVYEEGPRQSLAASLENGMEIICAGGLTVYAQRGVYQLVVELAQDAGVSRLHLEFERLKEKLREQGFFDPARKRSLPEHPDRVAVITSARGAAIQDFLRIAENRGYGARIRIYPVPVQGDEAPAALTAALERVNAEGWAEVAVLIRGGGSLEDLWAFNAEALAGAVFSSRIPVLAGIGHEVNFTLADLTADVRAATPSHAAQLLWPERAELVRRAAALAGALLTAEKRYLDRLGGRLSVLEAELAWRSPSRQLETWAERLGAVCARLRLAGERTGEKARLRLQNLIFALMRAPGRLPQKERAVADLSRRLAFAGQKRQLEAEHGLERLTLRLAALDPHEPLQRGYALVRKADGRFVREKSMVRPGEGLHVMVKDGEFPVVAQGETE